MNILEIKFLGFDKSVSLPLIDNMLSAGIMDDYLYEKVLFSITMEKTPADLVNYMYRLLWEYVYIKMPYQSNIKESFTEEYFTVHFTLSEAIAFLKSSLPKNYQNAITSIKEIEHNLQISLAASLANETTLSTATHHPLFKDTLNFKPFNTVEPQLMLAEKFKHLQDTKIGKIMIMSSSGPFNQIFSVDENKPFVFGIIEIHTDKLRDLFESGILENTAICNVTLNGFIMHIKFYKHSKDITPKFQSYIKETYQYLLK